MSHNLYILKIYSLLTSYAEGVSTGVLAKRMSVSPASASEMMKKLLARGLIAYDRKLGAKLTDSGSLVAIKCRRAELLWSKFFVEKLGLSIEDSSAYEDKVIELSDDKLLDSLDALLENPLFGVGGVAIPAKNGSLAHEYGVKLCDLSLPHEGVLVGVLENSSAFISYLKIRGIEIGSKLSIKERCEIDSSFVLQVNGGSSIHTISEKIASFLLLK